MRNDYLLIKFVMKYLWTKKAGGTSIFCIFLCVTDIKRLNNMMNNHGIYSTERLLIPVSNPEILINGTCYIELDTYAKHEVVVLYLDGKPERDCWITMAIMSSSISTLFLQMGRQLMMM